MLWKSPCALLILAGMSLAPGKLRADNSAFSIGPRPSWFLLGGVNSGATVVADQPHAFVGGELSLTRINAGNFASVYADAIYDFGAQATILTFGPGLGLSVREPQTVPAVKLPMGISVDGGVALRISESTAVGATIRLSLTLGGLLSLYSRYQYFDSGVDTHTVQAGVLLKFPLAAPF